MDFGEFFVYSHSMEIIPIRLGALKAPKASLIDELRKAHLTLVEGDIICISSKVVSIDEGRCVPLEDTSREELIREESDWYLKAPRTSKWRQFFTIAHGAMVGSAGVDESNGNGHYILYPKDPFKSAKRIRKWCMKEYGVTKLAVVITDSTSTPLRRGAIGFALAWDGMDPLRDYRGTKDIFGRHFVIELANLVDALAASAVFVMGEGREQTPLALIRNAPGVVYKNRSSKSDQLIVKPAEDIFAPLFWKAPWKKGKRSTDAQA